MLTPMSYSLDLRTRVVDAVDRGMTRQAVVATFQISTGTIKRWVARRQQTGTVMPRTPPGRPPTISTARYPALLAQVTVYPDATLLQHISLWQASHGVTVSRWTMSRAIRAAGWTRKKSR